MKIYDKIKRIQGVHSVHIRDNGSCLILLQDGYFFTEYQGYYAERNFISIKTENFQ